MLEAKLVMTTIPSHKPACELSASRARIASKADETRRQIERDLHDGLQQRLITLALPRARGSGLLGLKDRVETLGGTITVQSPLGGGTSLHVELPLRDEASDRWWTDSGTAIVRAYEERRF